MDTLIPSRVTRTCLTSITRTHSPKTRAYFSPSRYLFSSVKTALSVYPDKHVRFIWTDVFVYPDERIHFIRIKSKKIPDKCGKNRTISG